MTATLIKTPITFLSASFVSLLSCRHLKYDYKVLFISSLHEVLKMKAKNRTFILCNNLSHSEFRIAENRLIKQDRGTLLS